MSDETDKHVDPKKCIAKSMKFSFEMSKKCDEIISKLTPHTKPPEHAAQKTFTVTLARLTSLIGSKAKNPLTAESPLKIVPAASPDLQSGDNDVVTLIHRDINKIRLNLFVLEMAVDRLEETISNSGFSTEELKKRKRVVKALKNAIDLDCRAVDERFRSFKMKTSKIQRSVKTAVKPAVEQLHAESPAKKLKVAASPKPGPSTVPDIGEASCSADTPKKSKKKCKNKIWSKTKDERGSSEKPAKKAVSTISRIPNEKQIDSVEVKEFMIQRSLETAVKLGLEHVLSPAKKLKGEVLPKAGPSTPPDIGKASSSSDTPKKLMIRRWSNTKDGSGSTVTPGKEADSTTSRDNDPNCTRFC